MRRRVTTAIVLLVTLAGGAFTARPYVEGLSFVVRAADMQGPARRIAELEADAHRERELTIPTSRGSMRARLYEPLEAHLRPVLLVSGLHPSGIDEPRLIRVARQLSRSGLAVVTPDIPELSRFEITPAITTSIEESAVWLVSQSGLARDGYIGMMGISFSGGLSIVAAGRPSLANRVAYVFSFGGHDDLPRVLRYLCTGTAAYPHAPVRLTVGGTADTESERVSVGPPHDYGVAVILLGAVEYVAPASQATVLRDAVRRFLNASALASVDKDGAAREFDALKAAQKRLPEPSATLLKYVNDRDVVHLGARLLPYVSAYAGDPALSVSKSVKPAAPVYLLHGTDDNVIPAIESEHLAASLRPRGPVRLLLSGLISHAEADRPARVGDVMQLAAFWGDLLSR
jgi:dienelactone hydrolase